MKVFFLSPVQSSDGSSNQNTLETLAREEFDWNINRVGPLIAAQSPGKWLADIEQNINEAEIIVLLGPSGIISTLGPHAQNVVKHLLLKLQSGVPAIIDIGVNYFNHSKTYQTKEFKIANELLFKGLDIYPHHIRVSEEICAEGRKNTYICDFTKDDGCLLSPDIFEGVEKVIINQPILFNYDNDTYPLITASEQHKFINAGDLVSPTILGRKDTVALFKKSNGQYQVILPSGILSDSYDGLFEEIPGIECNIQFVKNILKLISKEAPTSEKIANELYPLFTQVERGVGILLKHILGDQLLEKLPSRVLEAITYKPGSPDMKHVCLSHMFWTICYKKNWEMFSKGMTHTNGHLLTRKEFTDIVEDVNKNPRRILAHPVRCVFDESLKLTHEDVKLIKSLLGIVERARLHFGCSEVDLSRWGASTIN